MRLGKELNFILHHMCTPVPGGRLPHQVGRGLRDIFCAYRAGRTRRSCCSEDLHGTAKDAPPHIVLCAHSEEIVIASLACKTRSSHQLPKMCQRHKPPKMCQHAWGGGLASGGESRTNPKSQGFATDSNLVMLGTFPSMTRAAEQLRCSLFDGGSGGATVAGNAARQRGDDLPAGGGAAASAARGSSSQAERRSPTLLFIVLIAPAAPPGTAARTPRVTTALSWRRLKITGPRTDVRRGVSRPRRLVRTVAFLRTDNRLRGSSSGRWLPQPRG